MFLKLPMFTCRALMVGLLPAAAENRHSPTLPAGSPTCSARGRGGALAPQVHAWICWCPVEQLPLLVDSGERRAGAVLGFHSQLNRCELTCQGLAMAAPLTANLRDVS